VPEPKTVIVDQADKRKWIKEWVRQFPYEQVEYGASGSRLIGLALRQYTTYIFPVPDCNKWDTCAPEAIVATVGVTVTDMSGRPILYHKDVAHPNSEGVLCTWSEHDRQPVIDAYIELISLS
jgi:3'-phosphoadenosine 5'-phosphosulfate (PAPS) 3'-phosphatase